MATPLQLIIDCGNELQLSTSFRCEAGRYRHSICLRKTSDEVLIDRWDDEPLSSDEDWPASPPIQQLSLETIAGMPALLGVGQAGKSHWSISVETLTQARSQPAIRFDLACRCPAPPDWLGSSYTRQVVDGNSDAQIRLTPDVAGSRSEDGGLIICCDHERTSVKKYPATFRWSYLITAS